jgi:hypothetical protein
MGHLFECHLSIKQAMFVTFPSEMPQTLATPWSNPAALSKNIILVSPFFFGSSI